MHSAAAGDDHLWEFAKPRMGRTRSFPARSPSIHGPAFDFYGTRLRGTTRS